MFLVGLARCMIVVGAIQAARILAVVVGLAITILALLGRGFCPMPGPALELALVNGRVHAVDGRVRGVRHANFRARRRWRHRGH